MRIHIGHFEWCLSVCVLDPLKLYLCLLNWVPSNGQIEGKSFRFSVCGFISKWQIYAGKWKMSNDLNDEKTLQCSNLREPTIARTRVFKTQLFFTNVLSAYFSVCFLCICVRTSILNRLFTEWFRCVKNPLLSRFIAAIYRSFYVWSFNSKCQANIKSHFCSENIAITTANVNIHAGSLNPIDSYCAIISVASKYRLTFLYDDSCKTSNRFENLHISYQFCCYSHFVPFYVGSFVSREYFSAICLFERLWPNEHKFVAWLKIANDWVGIVSVCLFQNGQSEKKWKEKKKRTKDPFNLFCLTSIRISHNLNTKSFVSILLPHSNGGK